MSSKDKEKTLPEKLKLFFKRGTHNVARGREEFILTDDTLKELRKESPISTRTRTLRDLTDIVLKHKLENNTVERLWYYVKDMFDKDQPTELRHLAFSFLQSLIKGQHDKLNIMKAEFFRFIKYHDNPEDTGDRLELFQALSSNGKDVLYFEEDVGPFLLNWLPDIMRAGKIQEYLGMVVIVIKFNAAYLDEEVITGFVQHVCVMCSTTNYYDTVIACLSVLDTIVAYSNMPPDPLPQFIGALCRTVILESYCQASWKIMRNLLGTHMGHTALYTMCRILQEPELKSEIGLLRGAIFYIHMALWGTPALTNLHCPPSSVLPSILQAVKYSQPPVAYEAVLGINRLVQKHGLDLQDPAWEILLDILAHVIRQMEHDHNNKAYKMLEPHLHETLNTIESLIENKIYNGSLKQFYNVIEACRGDRPECSILKLIMYLSRSIVPTENLWLTNMYNLLHKYFKPEIKTNIRIKVLDVLSNVLVLNRRQYEDELIDRIVIPHMTQVVNDPDVIIRTSVANLLVDLCKDCETKKCLEMLDILERLLNRPYEHHISDSLFSNDELADIKSLVTGLIQIFTVKIHKLPSSHAVKIYKMLVNFLELHYSKPKVFEHCSQIRFKIFDCFLKMRSDNLYHLGCMDDKGVLKYSRYLCVTYRSMDRGPMGSPPPASPAITQQPQCTVTYVSLRAAFKVFITCLKMEKDWEVLSLVLQEMPKVLQNKSLILSKQGNNELDLLVDILCAMISDKSLNLPESLNFKISKPDFHSAVLLVLVNLASYHNYLDQSHQTKMITCLQKCITTLNRSLKQCISALTICTLEMRDVMVKLLPQVLLNLSKISATIHIAIPILEFLSTLTQLPMVFANFVGDQYMAVFAIALPYTNPFKYNHYTVSLAHHVIAVWFLKCRLPLRKDFVKYITSGLQTNVLIPFEEEKSLKGDLSKLNEDSSDRKRSSSLTEQGSRRRAATVSARPENNSKTYIHRPLQDSTLITFYQELTETCIDLMARYAYSPCSALPKRLPNAEFLLNGGQTMTWLIGNKLVTVTTSGCSQKVLKHGLCDKCWTFCNHQNENKVLKSNKAFTDKENQESNIVTRQNSNDKSNNNTSANSPVDENKKIGDKLEQQLPNALQQLVNSFGHKQDRQICSCSCQEWAEIYVRRPTGDMSWVMRIQNEIKYQHSMYDFPLHELSTLYMPSLNPEYNNQISTESKTYSDEVSAPETDYHSTSSNVQIPDSPTKNSPTRQSSRDSVDDEECVYDDGTTSRNPVRRSNSSPEMSANWKNPLLHQKQLSEEDAKTIDAENVKKSKCYSKDMRVSCEAIPEEMAGMGTTPPSNEVIQFQKMSMKHEQSTGHPSLLSCHSYPESSPPSENAAAVAKPYQTVPHSPNITTSSSNVQPFPSRNVALLRIERKSDSLDGNLSDKGFERPNNLPNLSNLTPLTSKPPQSPTQTSPRLSRHSLNRDKDGHEIQKSSSSSILEKNSNLSLNLARERAKERKNSGSFERLNQIDPNQSQKRDRLNTISVMSPARSKQRSDQLRQPNPRNKDAPKSGINPSFIFLQLYHTACFGNSNERPMLVSNSSQMVQRSVKILDNIPPYETHKIGVIYIREGQTHSEVEILRNRFGSLRYVEFLQNLGTLIKLQDADPSVVFLGGLEQNGGDGKFAYIWQDDVIRVMFHVATMMPNKESDLNCNNKKLHIGNDNVTIVYNESGEEFNINTIKGQFNFASIIIQPLDHNTNRVTVKGKDELTELIGTCEPKIVSDQNVPILARQLALHANLASLVLSSLKTNSRDPYSSNWLERLRKIKNVRNKIQQDKNEQNGHHTAEEVSSTASNGSRKKYMEDFTDYT